MQVNSITNSNIFFTQVIRIMQRSSTNCCTRQLNWVHNCCWRYIAGPTDSPDNITDNRCLLFGREFISNFPARYLNCISKGNFRIKVVYFFNNSIDPVSELVSLSCIFFNIFLNFITVMNNPIIRINIKT